MVSKSLMVRSIERKMNGFKVGHPPDRSDSAAEALDELHDDPDELAGLLKAEPGPKSTVTNCMSSTRERVRAAAFMAAKRIPFAS